MTPDAMFDAAFQTVIAAEGGYTDDPADPGNWTGPREFGGECRGTNWGISAAAFPLLDIKALTLDDARSLYLAHYWTPIQAAVMPCGVGVVLFDCAVNQGVHAATIVLQRALRLKVDGWIGKDTLYAARNCAPSDTIIEICAQRVMLYANTAGWQTYDLGWMRRLFRVAYVAHNLKD